MRMGNSVQTRDPLSRTFNVALAHRRPDSFQVTQRLALAESPEEREARAARAAAAEQSRREAFEAQKRAEELEKQAVIEREKKRLEDEAKKAVEWRLKIDEAQKKGTEYAARW